MARFHQIYIKDNDTSILQQFNSKKCRICLKDGTVPIFKPKPKIGMIKLINVVTKLSIDKDDLFPKYVCFTCCDVLKKMLHFVKTARETRRILEGYLIDKDKKNNYGKLLNNSRNSIYRRSFHNKNEVFEVNDDTEKLQQKNPSATIKKSNTINFYNNCEFNKNNLNDKTEGKNRIELLSISENTDNIFEVSDSEVNDEVEMKSTQENKQNHCGKRNTRIFHNNSEFSKNHIMKRNKNKKKKSECYICDICGKEFLKYHIFRRHETTHEQKFLFECDLCSYKGRLKECLKRHMLTHMGVKKYKCEICGKGFHNSGNRKRHLLTHSQGKFECKICNRSYSRKSFLLRHNLAVHGEYQGYGCSLCNKQYVSLFQLKKHHNKVHKAATFVPVTLIAE